MQNPVFLIPEAEKEKFLGTLTDYFKYVEKQPDQTAILSAVEGYENLIRARTLDGKEDLAASHIYFDEALENCTKGFYTPSKTQRKRFKRNKSLRYLKSQDETLKAVSVDEKQKVDEMKSNLLEEYPSLNRRDLDEAIDNYCKLNVKMNTLMQQDIVKNNVAIKNLSDTIIKLGGYLGIDESQKAKQKAIKDKQSVAALSEEFQKTIEQYPQIKDRMMYKEIRILLEKYDRQEISKIMFELPQFAGMPVSDARKFVSEREAKYEAF